MSRGMAVAVVGPDGAGKTTLVSALPGALGDDPLVVYMGVNQDSQTHALPTMRWAQRRITPIATGVHDAASTAGRPRLLSVLRRAASGAHLLADQIYRVSIGMRARGRGRTVIFDRYIYDAEVDARVEGRGRHTQTLLRWIRRRFPAPDLLVVLDAPGSVLFARKGEHDVERLDGLRAAYAEIAGDVPHATRIDVTQDADTVLADVVAAIRMRSGAGR